jgi:hypothetical protein
MTTATKEPPNHNTLTCYTDYRCRRPECAERYNAYRRDRRRAENEGTWQPLVDAKPVRDHLLALQAAGIGAHRVAVLADLPYQTVREFLHHSYGHRRARRSRTSPETATKILAVSAAATLPGFVDATASRRRIQALVAKGWPMTQLGPRLGLNAKHVQKITTQRYVYHYTATAVEEAYDTLRTLRPERRGVDRRSADMARRRAASRRWPTPEYWDDFADLIGDPDFVPEYGRLRAEVIAEDAAWIMRTSGLDAEQTAERLGITRAYLHQAVARAKEAA